MSIQTYTKLPSWLLEHCKRLSPNKCGPDQSTTSEETTEVKRKRMRYEKEEPIRNLNLNLRRLNHDMMVALVESLQQNDDLETINLVSTLTGSTQDTSCRILQPLAQMLQRHPSLQVVHLSYNRLENVSSLGSVLLQNGKHANRLRELYLDYNQIDTASAIALAHALSQEPCKRTTTLRVLQLRSNRIGDVGGHALAMSLRDHSSLRTLGLSGNSDLGQKTGDALLDSLSTNLILTSISLDDTQVKCKSQVAFWTRANQVGRYLLRKNDFQQRVDSSTPAALLLFDKDKSQIDKDESKKLSSGTGKKSMVPNGLWPRILHGLEPNMVYFFLRQQPELLARTRG